MEDKELLVDLLTENANLRASLKTARRYCAECQEFFHDLQAEIDSLLLERRNPVRVNVEADTQYIQ